MCACGFLSFPSNTRAAAVASAADAESAISRLKRDPSVATATTLARFSHIKATIECALKDAGHVVGDDLSEARWRAAGGAGRTTGASEGVLSPDEFRNKRLAMFDRREGGKA